MKNRNREDAENNTQKSSEGSKAVAFKKNYMKKNIRRTGGRAISTNTYFNPAEIKKQREFYKNAKYVNKYKKSVKQQPTTNVLLSIEPLEEEKETVDDSRPNNNKKRKTREPRNIVEIYEKKHEEKEKARMEREAIFQAKKEEREKSEARRKATREKMMKRTRKGQPVMKYRIEHLLETIQGSVNKS